MERNDTAGRDRDFLTRLRVASGALGLVAQLEVTETGKLHGAAMLQAGANLVEKHIDKQLRFALRKTHPVKQNIDQIGFRHRRPDGGGKIILFNSHFKGYLIKHEG